MKSFKCRERLLTVSESSGLVINRLVVTRYHNNSSLFQASFLQVCFWIKAGVIRIIVGKECVVSNFLILRNSVMHDYNLTFFIRVPVHECESLLVNEQ